MGRKVLPGILFIRKRITVPDIMCIDLHQ